jgi:5-methylthioribose kinase
MHLIDASNAESYLRETGRLAPGETVSICELPGGVSNVVLYIANGQRFVLKQARPQLRVADPWFCSVERIWREVAVLHVCQQVLDAARADQRVTITTPHMLFEDRDNYLFAMSAAPQQHTVWKRLLLLGETDSRIAAQCGWLLGTLHAGTWQDPNSARLLADRQFFLDLRIDPYYRKVAEVHPDLAAPIDRLIDSVLGQRLALVHGDFSPKNLLVYEGGLMLVDFEVGHFGDPAFDLGFFLSHLVLKAIRAGADGPRYWRLTDEFWRHYRERMAMVVEARDLQSLEQRAILNFAGCLLARVDGKSKVEYLDAPGMPDRVRRLARRLLLQPPSDWQQLAAIGDADIDA